MKKVLLFISLLFLSINSLNATIIERLYIDAETEIAGGLTVKEIITVKDQTEDIKVNVLYNDKSLKKYKEDRDSLYGSDIYNGSSVSPMLVGTLNKDVTMETFLLKAYDVSYVTEIEYEEKDDEEYFTFILPKTDKKDNIYFLKYSVTNLLVEHNDCAEFYYKLVSNFDYDINNLTVMTKLPYDSELFKVWAHGDKNIKTTIDSGASMVKNEGKNFKKGSTLDNRIVFDKDLFMLNVNEHKKSKIDAIDIINSIENERLDNTKNKDVLLIVFLSSVGVLVLLIISYYIYINKRKK